MASAALGEGVAAFIGPLWKIRDSDAKNMAAAFYEALLMRRASLGDALSLARRSVKEGEPDLDQLSVVEDGADGGGPLRRPQSAGWAGMVLYGDPTPTVLQRLCPSDVGIVQSAAGSNLRRAARDAQEGTDQIA
jgi:CHAT domain-containing protein